MPNDLSRSEEYFRRSKDRGGDSKLLARGLLHLVKHLEPTSGRDFNRAKELLNRAWKYNGASSMKNIAEAMHLITRGMKKDE